MCSGGARLCCASSHLPKRELSPASSSPFHNPTRISCKEPRHEQRRSKTLPSPLPEQSEAANPNSTASQPEPAASGQLEHGNPPGQHLPSLKLNQQLMNISQRQTGQVDRVNHLFMSIREGKAVGRDIQAQPGRGHLPVKISWPRPLVQLMHIPVLWASSGTNHARRWRCPTSSCHGDTQPCFPADLPRGISSRDEAA